MLQNKRCLQALLAAAILVIPLLFVALWTTWLSLVRAKELHMREAQYARMAEDNARKQELLALASVEQAKEQAQLAQERAKDAERLRQLNEDLRQQLAARGQREGLTIPMEFADRLYFRNEPKTQLDLPLIEDHTARLLGISKEKREELNALLQKTWLELVRLEATMIEVQSATPLTFEISVNAAPDVGALMQERFLEQMRRRLTPEQYILWRRSELQGAERVMLSWGLRDCRYIVQTSDTGLRCTLEYRNRRNRPQRTRQLLAPPVTNALSRFRRLMHEDMAKHFEPLPEVEAIAEELNNPPARTAGGAPNTLPPEVF